MDKIRIFKSKNISEMKRQELLDFAFWATREITRLEKIAAKHMELDLTTETYKLTIFNQNDKK